MTTSYYLISCLILLLIIILYLSPRAKTMSAYWVLYGIEIVIMITVMNLLETILTQKGVAQAGGISFGIVMLIALLLGINGWQMQKRIQGKD